MIGVYFSGTGNTKFCVDKFLKEYDHSENSFPIEDNRTLKEIENHNEIVIGYPVQYSNILIKELWGSHIRWSTFENAR